MSDQIEEKPNSSGSISSTSIESLDFYCLVQIFRHLPIVDRIRIERVCMNWKSASRASWNSFKTLNFHEETWGIARNSGICINDHIFTQVISRCAKYLTHIDFSTESIEYEYNCINHQLSHCAVLKLLRLGPAKIKELQMLNMYHCICNNNLVLRTVCTEEWEAICHLLMDYAPNITKFAIDYSLKRVCHCNDNDFCALLSAMKNLKSFKTGCFFAFSPMYLYCLPANSIEYLSLQKIDSTIFILILRTLRNLRILELVNFRGPPEIFFDTINVNSTSIRNLKFTTCFQVGNPYFLISTISRLAYIEKLNFPSSAFISDPFLQAISMYYKNLTHLCIYDCGAVTDSGIASIANMNIRVLYIGKLPKLCHPPLARMKQLEELHCRKCYALETKVITDLLHCAPRLRLLDIRNSFLSISQDIILRTALETELIRDPNITLTLYINNLNTIDNRIHHRGVSDSNTDIFNFTDWFFYTITQQNFVLHVTEDFVFKHVVGEKPFGSFPPVCGKVLTFSEDI